MKEVIDFDPKFIAQQTKWDEQFRDPENWTGESTAKFTNEAQADIDRTSELVGDVVESMSRSDAKRVARAVQQKIATLRDAFADRLRGTNAHEMLVAYFMGPIFGFNIYAEGTSGVGKTWTMEQLSKCLRFPFATLHARSDTSDAELIGEERLVRGAKGENHVAFAPGVVTKPGVVGVLIDEFPRLPARSSNSCLQAMEDKWVRVPLNSLQRPDHKTILSWGFSFIACGNPANYVGQGERNRALFDRFAIGVEVVRPNDKDTIQMYEHRDVEVQHEGLDEFEFSFREARAATRFVNFIRHPPENGLPNINDQFQQLMAASAAISPTDYLLSTRWGNRDFKLGKEDFVSQTLFQFNEQFSKDQRLRSKKSRLAELREEVNQNIVEGSNPRGELQVLEVARALRLLEAIADNELLVTPEQMSRAFVMANLMRLKPYPGCEDSVRKIVEKAADIFFF